MSCSSRGVCGCVVSVLSIVQILQLVYSLRSEKTNV
jgi:hypothetical protein